MLCGAVGFTPEEAAERLNIAANTVKVNIRKVKEKTHWHKISELSASAVCEYLGVDYSKIRREILESVKVSIMIIFLPFFISQIEDEMLIRRRIARQNIRRIEEVYRTESTI